MEDGGLQWWQESGVQQEYEAWMDNFNEENMPKISEMTQSKYLKQSDIDEEVIVTIAKIGQGNLSKEGDAPDMKWMVRLVEFDKPMVINTTNIKRLAKACGSDDTDDWIGKKVTLYVDHDVEFAGNIVGGLRFRGSPVKAVAPKTDFDKMLDNGGQDIPFLFNITTVCDTMGLSKSRMRIKDGPKTLSILSANKDDF